MQLIVLGAAAGGGFPQWNCNCGGCARARAGDPAAVPRTQSSLAVSADGSRWLLLNASPDLRQQILATPALHPREGLRHSPIAAVAVTNGDVDHVGGLITLREGQPFALHGTAQAQATLDASPVFEVVNRARVPRRTVPLDTPTPITDAAGEPIGLTATLFAVPGKVPLYQERAGADLAGTAGDTVGVRLEADDGRGGPALYVPNCARIDDAVRARLADAAVVFMDGTLFRDDELIQAGLGHKTGQRMGHVSIDGPDGVLARLADLAAARKILVHLNNSNPALLADSPARAQVDAAGWEVAHDGLEVRL